MLTYTGSFSGLWVLVSVTKAIFDIFVIVMALWLYENYFRNF